MTKGQKAQIRRCFEKINAELNKLQAIADELDDKYNRIPFEKMDTERADRLLDEVMDLQGAIMDINFGVAEWMDQHED